MPFLLSLFGGAAQGAGQSANAFTNAVNSIEQAQVIEAQQSRASLAIGIGLGVAALGGLIYFATKK